MVFQVLEHLRLHMRNKLGLPLVNEGEVHRPFQHPFGPFDAQRMERIMERLPVWPALWSFNFPRSRIRNHVVCGMFR